MSHCSPSRGAQDATSAPLNHATFFFPVDTRCTSHIRLLSIVLIAFITLPAVFVEALDKCFENVCELDLIFHSDKVK